MLRRILASASIAFAVSMFAASDAAATAQRTYVASNGIDTNPCTIVSPCRGFTAALAHTASGGEIIVLDSAGYGPVTITQPVSIIAPSGVYAGVSVSSGTGIVVNPGSGTVVLSGLTINGLGGTRGIEFQSGDTLRIERTTVSGFAGGALNATALGAAATLIVHDSMFVANINGIVVATTTGIVTVEIDGSRFDQNTDAGAAFLDNVSGVVSGSSFSINKVGAYAQPKTSGATNKMTFRHCVFSSNSSDGLITGLTAGTTTQTLVADSEISYNGHNGVQAQTASTVTMSNTTVTHNENLGIGGNTRSFQDNRLYGNTTDGSFAATIGKL